MQMGESEIYLLISRHLSFKTNAAEDERLYEWVARSKENELVFEQLRTIWLSTQKNANEEADTLGAFTELKNRLRLRESEAEGEPAAAGKRLKRWISFAAASIILVTGSVLLREKIRLLFGDKPVYLERTAKAGESNSFTLGEGTFVCLAPGSRIVYPEKFTSDSRRISLAGQAFFRVGKNPHQPFIVVSGRLSTEVLGTTFTVSAFDNQEKISIALLEGKIRVTDSAHLFNCLLQPGKEFLYNKNTNETSVRDIDSGENVTGWIDRRLVFNNITLGEAAAQIQAVYGTRLIFENKAASDCHIWGRFTNEPLSNILETIRLAGDIKCVQGPQNTFFISKTK
jgi:ferric-dicitrate binding protein FerR (iron transport regulator)